MKGFIFISNIQEGLDLLPKWIRGVIQMGNMDLLERLRECVTLTIRKKECEIRK